jgi:drug/metabolite transporter (DMT)-like permease
LSAFAAIYFVWGSTYLFIHFAIQDLPPFVLAALRFLIAGAVLYAWSRVQGAPSATAREWRSCIIIGALFFLCGNGAVVWSQQRLPSGITALLVAIVPVYVVLLEWIRPPHKQPRAITLIGVLLGLAGLILLIGPDAFSKDASIDPVGALVLACGSLTWAYGTLWAQRAPLPKSSLLAASMQLLSGGALLALAALISGDVFEFAAARLTVRGVLSLVYLITFGSILAFTAYGWLVRVAPASRVSTYAYVNPVVALLLGWLFANERFSTRMLLASAVIISGVALITIGTHKHQDLKKPT